MYVYIYIIICLYIDIYGCSSKCKVPIHTPGPHAIHTPWSISMIHTPLEDMIHTYDPYLSNCKSWACIGFVSELYLWNSSVSVSRIAFWVRGQGQLFDACDLYIYLYVYIYTHTHIYIYADWKKCRYIYIKIYICKSTYRKIHIYMYNIYTYIHVFKCTYRFRGDGIHGIHEIYDQGMCWSWFVAIATIKEFM